MRLCGHFGHRALGVCAPAAVIFQIERPRAEGGEFVETALQPRRPERELTNGVRAVAQLTKITLLAEFVRVLDGCEGGYPGTLSGRDIAGLMLDVCYEES